MFRRLLLLIPLCASLASATAIRNLSGLTANVFGGNDDSSTGPHNLGFLINVFGVTATQVFINNNGNFTVGSSLATFTPSPLANINQIMFAAFWGDVDTRVGNTVTFGTTTVNGNNAFGAWWNDVGYYNGQTDKLNNFQILLITRPDTCPIGLPNCGNFDIEYNYGKVEWETGSFSSSGGVNGLGGNSARVGYTNGAGASFELPGSAINGAFLDGGPNALVDGSFNSNVAGRYIFQVRNNSIGAPGSSPQTPVLPNSTNSNGQLVFNNVPSGNWTDPPGTFGFDYVATGGSLFRQITLPTGFSSPFRIFTGAGFGNLLGTFAGGSTVDFEALLGAAIASFRLVDIDPTVDTDANPTAFPLQIFFAASTGSFTQTPLVNPASGVPEPSTFALGALAFAAFAAGRRFRSRRS